MVPHATGQAPSGLTKGGSLPAHRNGTHTTGNGALAAGNGANGATANGSTAFVNDNGLAPSNGSLASVNGAQSSGLILSRGITAPGLVEPAERRHDQETRDAGSASIAPVAPLVMPRAIELCATALQRDALVLGGVPMEDDLFEGLEQAAAPHIPSWKRILDLTCVIATFPCWLLVMLVIALWIKAVSSGPLFFRQERVGYRGRRFMIMKFRSMKVGAETLTHEQYVAQLMEADSPMIKLDLSGDPRLIRGARLLRALGLDELPQLFNVLLGDMSLVGPRPCTSQEFARYQAWQRERVNALPGLTGYWQVNGKNRTTFSEMIAMDLFYTANMSIWLDLTIMLKTAPALARQILDSRKPSWWKWTRQTFVRKPADNTPYADAV